MAHPASRNPSNQPRPHAPAPGPAAASAQGRAAPQPQTVDTPPPITHVNLDRCRLSLIKGEHRWRFRWERGSEAALICAVADLARNPNMNFDWFDAAVVCRHITRNVLPTPAASSAPRPQDGTAQISPAPEM